MIHKRIRVTQLSLLSALLGMVLAVGAACHTLNARKISVVIDPQAAPRVQFGAQRLVDALKTAGLDPAIGRSEKTGATGRKIVVGTIHQGDIARLIGSGRLKLTGEPGKEGFVLATCADGTVAVVSGDDSGALYGCLELAKRIREAGGLPADLQFADAPVFKLRGPCIGMQKTFILPGRRVYEYPYTPELFPFFYDKEYWREYLDYLVENRFNTLYLWNGHPFASLVKLEDYPYAIEVP
jgi:hypothetical protein